MIENSNTVVLVIDFIPKNVDWKEKLTAKVMKTVGETIC